MVTACKALTAATSGLTQWLIALGCWASQEAMKDQLQHLKGSQVSRQPSQQTAKSVYSQVSRQPNQQAAKSAGSQVSIQSSQHTAKSAGSQVSRQPSQQTAESAGSQVSRQASISDKVVVCRSTPPALRAALKVKLVASTVREELTM